MPETHAPLPRPVMLADLNFEPAESDGEDLPAPADPQTQPPAAIAVPVAPAPVVAADSSTR